LKGVSERPKNGNGACIAVAAELSKKLLSRNKPKDFSDNDYVQRQYKFGKAG
jgi:hypothetical protein